MNLKVVKDGKDEFEQNVPTVPMAYMVAIPALSLAISRGEQVVITCNDERGNVFRIQTPKRPPCVHDGLKEEKKG